MLVTRRPSGPRREPIRAGSGLRETRGWDGGERAGGAKLVECGDGVGIAVDLVVVVVGRPAGHVANPAGRFEGDAVGIGEVDGVDASVFDDVGGFAVGLGEPSPQVVERGLVGKV